MILTPDNYHSPEARAAYISSSDIKLARRCEAMWRAQDQGLYQPPEHTEAFTYGQLFEAALTGQAEAYIARHPELLLTRGLGKGTLRSAYADALELAQAVRRSPFLADLIDRCRKQVIFTGTLGGIPARAMATCWTRMAASTTSNPPAASGPSGMIQPEPTWTGGTFTTIPSSSGSTGSWPDRTA